MKQAPTGILRAVAIDDPSPGRRSSSRRTSLRVRGGEIQRHDRIGALPIVDAAGTRSCCRRRNPTGISIRPVDGFIIDQLPLGLFVLAVVELAGVVVVLPTAKRTTPLLSVEKSASRTGTRGQRSHARRCRHPCCSARVNGFSPNGCAETMHVLVVGGQAVNQESQLLARYLSWSWIVVPGLRRTRQPGQDSRAAPSTFIA